MKNWPVTATLTLRNMVWSSLTCQRTSLKISVRRESNVVFLMEFCRCDSLDVCSKRTCSRSGFYSQQRERVHEILKLIYPKLVNGNRVLLELDNADSILHDQLWQKFRNWEKSSCYHTRIQSWSSAFRLPSASIHGPFLAWKKFRNFQLISKLSHQHQSLVPSRDNKHLCA